MLLKGYLVNDLSDQSINGARDEHIFNQT